MTEFKYIMFEATVGTITYKVPIIFPSKLVHASVAKAMTRCMMEHWRNSVQLVRPANAGKLQIVVTDTEGGSETLGLMSDPDDANVINTYNYCHGIK